MGCPDCRKIIRAAGPVNVASLIRAARAGADSPLQFCPACKAGTRNADGAYGLTPAEACADAAADAPGTGDINYTTTYDPASGATMFSVTQGTNTTGGTLPFATLASDGSATILEVAANAGINFPVGTVIPIATSGNTSTSGSVSTAPGALPGSGGGILGVLKRTEAQHKKLLIGMAIAGGVVVALLLTWHFLYPPRKKK